MGDERATARCARDRLRRPCAHRRRLGARPADAARRRRTSTSKSSACRPIAFARCSSRSVASRRSARASRSTRWATIDVSLPRRESKAGRGHRGFDVAGDPSMTTRGSGATARLHRQRHRLGSADRRVPRPVRRPRRSRAPRAARRRSVDVRRRQPARAARRSVRGALRPRRSTTRPRAICRRIALDDLPAERVWGEIEKLLFAPGPSIGFALALDLGVVDKLFPELHALVGCVAGAGVAPGGRRLGPHAAGRRSGAHAQSTTSPRPAAARDHAGRRLPRLRQAGDHRVSRRPHPIDRSRGAGRRAGDGVSRSPERATRSTATTCASRCSASSAQHLKPGMWFKVRDEVGDGAFRRLAQKVDLELLARLAKVGLPRPRAGRRSTATRWTGSSSAPARSASSIARRPDSARSSLAGARVESRAAGRRDPEGGLRAAARWGVVDDLDEAVGAARALL